MPKFYAHLMNLAIDADNHEDALTDASLDLVTMHILDYLGNDFKLVISDVPLELQKTINVEFPDSLPEGGDIEC